MARDPGFYDYLPYDDRRPPIRWPGGARVAFWVAPNVEFYELNPPRNPARAPWPRPTPDVQNYSYRDYGNRVGFWRMLDAMKRCNMRGSVSLNVAVCEHHPEVIQACAENGWEFYSHGTYNTRYLMGMDEAQERAVIQDSIDTIKKHTGQKLDGWLAPALTYTERTMDLVAEMGLTYVCDLFHDDQPGPVKVKKGKLTSIPYSLEMNDTIVYNVNLVSPRRYADILKQVRDSDFEHQLHERLELAERDKQSAVELARAKLMAESQKQGAEREAEIQRLKAQLEAGEVARQLPT